MIFVPDSKMFTNRFSDVALPTKAQIFARTGKVAVSPAGFYTGDEVAEIGLSKTEQAEKFAQAAEAFEKPKSESDAQ